MIWLTKFLTNASLAALALTKLYSLTGNAAYEQTECVAREAPDGYTFDRSTMKMVREADRKALDATETKKREEEAAQQAAEKKREQVAQLRRAADTLREFINY